MKLLTQEEVEGLAESLHALLDAIRRGEVTMTEETTLRLEGALVALEAVLGRAEEALRALMGEESI